MELTSFKVTKYRNVWDSGWIEANKITAFVGQNEAGKSNLFEALYRINPFVPNETYNIDEDWPVDDWGNKDPSAVVCEANSRSPQQRSKPCMRKLPYWPRSPGNYPTATTGRRRLMKGEAWGQRPRLRHPRRRLNCS